MRPTSPRSLLNFFTLTIIILLSGQLMLDKLSAVGTTATTTASNTGQLDPLEVLSAQNETGGSSKPTSAASLAAASAPTDSDLNEHNEDHVKGNLSPRSATNPSLASHQNYPIEPYPSASYTANLVHAPPSNPSISALLNRDHHLQQPPASGATHNQRKDTQQDLFNGSGDNQQQQVFSNSYGNQMLVGAKSHDLSQFGGNQYQQNHFPSNHNFGSGASGSSPVVATSSSSLNTGLIQNLTASLFPARQLSNGTLYALSELLNRTRQAYPSAGSPSSSSSASVPSTMNGYKPNHLQQSNGFTPTMSNGLNYLDTILSDQPLSLLDYIKQPSSQFGFREPHSMARFQPLSTYSRPASSGISSSGNSGASFKSSNLYNTYLPLRDNNLNSATSATNGQAINMAASIYDNYLDQGKYPLLIGDLKSQLLEDQSRKSPQNNNQQYQYIQHHNVNNQDHLDKIVYHSTPFRPSIVSPPSLPSMTNSSAAQHSQNKPKTEADHKSVAFASASDSQSIDNFMMANGQSINASKHSAGDSSRKVAARLLDQHRNKHHHLDELDFDHQLPRFYSANSSSSTSNNNNQLHHDDHSLRNSATSANKSTVSASQSLSGPQLLFELYEREIDNQIKEALYSDHYNRYQMPLDALQEHATGSMGVAAGGPISQALVGGSTAWPYEEGAAPLDQAILPSWSRPVALRHPPSLLSPATDPLAAALSELPTFAASDLRSIVPNGPAYSLLSTGQPQASELAASEVPQQQLLSIGQQLPSASGLFGGDQDYSSAASSKPSVATGLPSILSKLHSGQLSSILTSPFAHLYASLPRYRYKSKQPQSSQSPNSMGGKHLWTSLGGNHVATISSSGVIPSETKATALSKQQAAALVAATAAANLIASTGQAITPLQAALIQAQLATSTYLSAEPLADSSSPLITSQSTSSLLDPTQSSIATEQQQALAGGGISPLIWRSVFSPINWARKQSSSGQNNSYGSQQVSSISKPSAAASSIQSNRQASLPLVGSLWASNTPLPQLLSPITSASNLLGVQSTLQQHEQQSQRKKPAKLKIRILKIPVAVYDTTSVESSQTAEVSSTMGMMPAHLQPAATASLLASLPCALQHNQAAILATSPYQPQGLETSSTSGGGQAASASAQAPATGQFPVEQHVEQPIQHFININQPADLQVSPTTATNSPGKLMRLLNGL